MLQIDKAIRAKFINPSKYELKKLLKLYPKKKLIDNRLWAMGCPSSLDKIYS
tara:strand:+ start:250 stop:405 length:156 start_codon:yes stop_codon:yes gene_type:complete